MTEENGFRNYTETPYFKVPITERIVVDKPTESNVDLVLLPDGNWQDYHPDLVFTSKESSATLAQALSETVESIYANHPGATITGIVNFGMHHVGEAKLPVGKHLRFSYPVGADVSLTRWIWLMTTGTHQLQITGTTAGFMEPMLRTVFGPLVGGIHFLGDQQTLLEKPKQAAGVEANLPYRQPAPQSGELVRGFKTRWLLPQQGIVNHRQLIQHVEVTVNGQTRFYKTYIGRKGAFILRSAGQNCLDLSSSKLTWYWIAGEQVPADIFGWLGLRPFPEDLVGKSGATAAPNGGLTSESATPAEVSLDYLGERLAFTLASGFVSYHGGQGSKAQKIPTGPVWSGNFYELLSDHIRGVFEVFSRMADEGRL